MLKLKNTLKNLGQINPSYIQEVLDSIERKVKICHD
jgi:hypothetical protein